MTSSASSFCPGRKSCPPPMSTPRTSAMFMKSTLSRDFCGSRNASIEARFLPSVSSRVSGRPAISDACDNRRSLRSRMSFAAASATMPASSSNCFERRSFDSYKATAASTSNAPTATATVRPTSARRRLGAKSWLRNRTGRLEAGQDLLPLRTLHKVQEGLDGRLHFGRVGVRDEVQRSADRVRAVSESVARHGNAVDREHADVACAKGLRVHRHHADRILERSERLEGLVDLEDLDGVLRIDRLRRSEEIRLERGACR